LRVDVGENLLRSMGSKNVDMSNVKRCENHRHRKIKVSYVQILCVR